jgi:hypothetical protein
VVRGHGGGAGDAAVGVVTGADGWVRTWSGMEQPAAARAATSATAMIRLTGEDPT